MPSRRRPKMLASPMLARNSRGVMRSRTGIGGGLERWECRRDSGILTGLPSCPAPWRQSPLHTRFPYRAHGGPEGAGGEYIRIRGARTHNLKNMNLDLPRNRLVVITGLSGSGKSSLAFDTLYAEGQRRYVESLSAYARQFLELMEKPDVDLIEGLSPAISIEQKATSHNPRSTVGTVTEIHDYLRLLFARIGDPHCPDHGITLTAQSVSQMVDHVLTLPADTRLMVLAPLIVGRKGEQADLFEELRAQGFVRIRVDGKVHELDELPKLNRNMKHTVEVVVDRLRVRPDAKQRLAESFETALRHADGRALAVEMDTDKEHLFSARFACPICSYSLPGAGTAAFLVQQPDGRVSRAATGWAPSASSIHGASSRFRSFRSPPARSRDGTGATSSTSRCCSPSRNHYSFDLEQPYAELPENVQQAILHGSGKQKIPFLYVGEQGNKSRTRTRLRRRPAQSRAPVSRDGFRGRARRACEISQHPALSGMRRDKAAAGSALRHRHRQGDLRSLRAAARPMPSGSSSTSTCPE